MHEHTDMLTECLSSSSSIKKEINKERKTRQPRLTDEEYFLALKNNPAYRDIDIDIQIGKCQAWCLSNNVTFTRKRLVNWLNRADKPITFIRPASSPVLGLSKDAEERIKEIEARENGH